MGRSRKSTFEFKRKIVGSDGNYYVQIGFGLVEGPHPYIYVVDKEVSRKKTSRLRVGGRVAKARSSPLPHTANPKKRVSVAKAG